MTLLARACLAALLLANPPLVSRAAQSPAAAPDRAADAPIRLADLMAMMAAVPESRATFHEEKRFAALAVPLESSGHLLYRRPRISWRRPPTGRRPRA